MWPVLQEQCDTFKIKCVFTESNLTMTHPNGARLQLFGADMKNFIRRLKGVKTPGAAIDEAQDFGSHLRELVDDVLTPTLTDYEDSWLAITGTPGPIPFGFFYEITELRLYGFSFHSWTLLDNPYLPNAATFIEELKKKRAWQDTHPTLLREWRNKWVLDREALVFQYDEQRNHYQALPTHHKAWDYVIGVDLGHDDADAIAVLAWHEEEQAVYLVEEDVRPQQGITELALKLKTLIEKYKPVKVVVDTGGLGKKITEEIIRRHGLVLHPADKQRKFEYIELLNDALRTKKLMAKSASLFAQDSTKVKWETDTQELKISDSFHSDICDAVLYAFRECYHYLFEPKVEELAYGSKAWADHEAKRMEREAEEHFQKQHEAEMEQTGWQNFV